jgi:hypothetical protein
MIGVAEHFANPLLARLSFRTKHKLIGRAILKAARRPAVPCVTNIGAARAERLDFAGLRPSQLGLAASPSPFPIFLMVAVKYDGVLTLSMSGYGADLSRERAAAFLARVEREMCEILPVNGSAGRRG